MTDRIEPGFPPGSVAIILRIEGLTIAAAAFAAFYLTGASWWLFAALILAPDLSMLGWLAGPKIGWRIYNLAHTYSVPVILGGIGWFAGIGWLVPVALVWIAHIGLDRVLGYGLKYPGSFHATHLGLMGKARKGDADLANAS